MCPRVGNQFVAFQCLNSDMNYVKSVEHQEIKITINNNERAKYDVYSKETHINLFASLHFMKQIIC